MKKFSLIISSLFMIIATGQYKVQDGSELLSLKRLPMEKMYVHHSTPLLFSGEYLYYKVYCINAQTNKLDNISSMAYVALIDEDGNSVFEHKLRLDKGMANSDFFIGTDLPSGHYKLVAYTQWMKNGGLQQLFKDDISILNPYNVNQSGLLDSPAQISASRVRQNIPENDNLMTISSDEDLLQLQLDSSIYSTRSKVKLTLRNYKGPLAHGNYSLVVRKIDDFAGFNGLSAEDFVSAYLNVDKQLPQTIGDSIYLPEQRGELIYGKVIQREGGKPAKDKRVVISIPGKDFLLKSSLTDADGNFFTYVRKEYKTPQIVVQVLNEEEYDIFMGKGRGFDFSVLEFKGIAIDTSDAKTIRQRSLYNQIENAYFGAKPDSILAADQIDPFDGGLPEVYNLDDYTRFSTLEETLIEILNTVGYRSRAGGEYIRVLQEFEKFNEPYNDFPAIVLIDGVFIPDHSSIKKFNAQQIERIKILRDQLVLGTDQYQGLVSIETKQGDYYEGYSGKNALLGKLVLPRQEKNYFIQRYEPSQNEKFGRIPDYRQLLLWEPNISIDGSSYEIEFFTSDVKGGYEIILEGFTSYGKPQSLKKDFKVE